MKVLSDFLRDCHHPYSINLWPEKVLAFMVIYHLLCTIKSLEPLGSKVGSRCSGHLGADPRCCQISGWGGVTRKSRFILLKQNRYGRVWTTLFKRRKHSSKPGDHAMMLVKSCECRLFALLCTTTVSKSGPFTILNIDKTA